VQRPLAAVLARADGPVRRPREMQGHRVGVSGLPSDEAVVDSEVEADGGDPDAVEAVTIGFNAVASLAAGKVDAATGFWNAEAIALRRQGVPTRVFKVDEFGAPPYPELILATSRKTLENDPKLVESMIAATRRGYEFTEAHPSQSLDDLLAANPELEEGDQKAQLDALLPVLQPRPFNRSALEAWAAWDLKHGLLEEPLDVKDAFSGF
jgi:putative hydroxymethylpyrimidine transport system substrate-binding protein